MLFLSLPMELDWINENDGWNNCDGRLYRKGWRCFAVALMNVFVQSWNRRRWPALASDGGTRDVTWPLRRRRFLSDGSFPSNPPIKWTNYDIKI